MTLDTRIRIIEPTPVRPVFDEARRLLGAENARFYEDIQTHDWPDEHNVTRVMGCNRVLAHEPGQGYDAWFMLYYGNDGPLVDWPCECAPHSCECAPRASLELSFDTPYGYSPNNLHAWLVRELGHWCDERGLTWYWENEYTGEWHKGLEGLADFGDPDQGARFATGIAV